MCYILEAFGSWLVLGFFFLPPFPDWFCDLPSLCYDEHSGLFLTHFIMHVLLLRAEVFRALLMGPT